MLDRFFFFSLSSAISASCVSKLVKVIPAFNAAIFLSLFAMN